MAFANLIERTLQMDNVEVGHKDGQIMPEGTSKAVLPNFSQVTQKLVKNLTSFNHLVQH